MATSPLRFPADTPVDLNGPVTHTWVAATARVLMKRHGLGPEWKFDWDRAQRRFGACHYSTKRISMSYANTPHRTRAECAQTILHEIAHALTPGAHHGPKWKAKCREIGLLEPERCSDAVVAADRPKAPYVLVCTACGGSLGERYRRTNVSNHRHTVCSANPSNRPAPNTLVYRRNA